jgi:antibiotic biosynthesis monooxygenase (ABM) superfamily enzyme
MTREAEPRPPAAPVTVIVSRRPKPGREADVERWIEEAGRAVAAWPGYRGIEVFKPHPPEQEDYVVVFRFASEEQLDAWMHSDERREHLKRLEPLLAEPEHFVVTGMEGWFALPGPQALPPPRWKMAIVIWSAIFLMIVVIDALLGDWLGEIPSIPRTLLTTAATVSLMTWGVMPVVTRFLSGWLYSRR